MAQPYQLTCASLLKDAVVQLLRQKVVYNSTVDLFGTICIRVDKSQDEIILKLNEKLMRNTIMDTEESTEIVAVRQTSFDGEITRKNLNYGMLKPSALESKQAKSRRDVSARNEKDSSKNSPANKAIDSGYRSRRKSKPVRGCPSDRMDDEDLYLSSEYLDIKLEPDAGDDNQSEVGLKLIHSPQPTDGQLSIESILENDQLTSSSLSDYPTAIGHASEMTSGLYIKTEPKEDNERDFDPFLALQLHPDDYPNDSFGSPSSLSIQTPELEKGKWRTTTSGPQTHIAAIVKEYQGVNIFQCASCAMRFKTIQACCNHNKTDHRIFMCRVCYKGFSRSTTLSRHTSIHTGSKPYKCTICDAQFNRRYRLKNHVLNYHVQQRFPCTFCPPGIIVCNDFRNLQVHLQQKHGISLPFLCQECKTVVKGWITYMQHLGFHPGHSAASAKAEIKVPEVKKETAHDNDDEIKQEAEADNDSAESNTA